MLWPETTTGVTRRPPPRDAVAARSTPQSASVAVHASARRSREALAAIGDHDERTHALRFDMEAGRVRSDRHCDQQERDGNDDKSLHGPSTTTYALAMAARATGGLTA